MASRAVRQPSRRVIANRRNGSRGGQATVRNHTAEFLSQRGEKGGQAVRDRYGRSYYRYIGKLKKNYKGWPKGKPRKKLSEALGDALNGTAQGSTGTTGRTGST